MQLKYSILCYLLQVVEKEIYNMNEIIIEEILKELSKKYNKKEQVIKIMFEKTSKVIYNIKEFENSLREFYKT